MQPHCRIDLGKYDLSTLKSNKTVRLYISNIRIMNLSMFPQSLFDGRRKGGRRQRKEDVNLREEKNCWTQSSPVKVFGESCGQVPDKSQSNADGSKTSLSPDSSSYYSPAFYIYDTIHVITTSTHHHLGL